MEHTTGFNQQNWTAFPEGERLLPLESLTQIIPIGVSTFLNFFLASHSAVAVTLILAWSFSGFVTAAFARFLGASNGAAVGAGVLCQMLPGLANGATSVPGVLWYGFVLLVLTRSLVWHRRPSRRNTLLLLLALLSSAGADGYVFYAGLICHLVVLLFTLLERRRRGQTTPFVALALVPLLLPLLAYVQAIFLSAFFDSGRRFRTPRLELWERVALHPFDYFRPHPESLYFGLSENLFPDWTGSEPRLSVAFPGLAITLVILLGVFFSLRNGLSHLRLAYLSALVLGLLSIQPNLKFYSLEVWNPAILLLPLIPGSIYLDRLGNFAMVVLIATAGAVLSLKFRLRSRAMGAILSLLIVAVTAMENSPLAIRKDTHEALQYSSIRAEISGDPVVFLPQYFVGRLWYQQEYIGSPMVNSIDGQLPVNDSLTREIQKNPRTDPRKVCDFREVGADYAVVEETWLQGSSPLARTLSADDFEASLIVSVKAHELGETRLYVFDLEACETSEQRLSSSSFTTR